MFRSFEDHHVRKQVSLCGIWDLQINDRNLKCSVPSCWESIPGLEDFRGVGTYTKTIRLESAARVRFVFRGVSFLARVYFDEKLIASHEDAYTEFVSDAIIAEEGTHSLKVVVDNRFSEDSTLHVPNDYMSYGGITRACFMEELSCASIETVHVRTHKKGGAWEIAASVVIRNHLQTDIGIGFRLAVLDHEIRVEDVCLRPGENNLDFTLPVPNAEDWLPDSPKLYLLTTELIYGGQKTDDLIERIGFREVKAENGRIRINGKPIRIIGVNRHEEYGGFGCAVPEQGAMHDLLLMKDLHINAVRTCHYPNDPLFLDLCDELGFVVWEEGHARGLSLKQMLKPNFERQSAASVSEMIQQHFNHPSILFWGILNECSCDTEEGYECYARLFRLIRSLDDSRICVSASCQRGASWGLSPSLVCSEKGDLCHELEDAVCHNIYPGWYIDIPTGQMVDELYRAVQEHGGRGKPFIISEIGAGAIYGYHDPGLAKWSEESQAEMLKEQLTALLSNEHLAGFFLWQFADVRVTSEGGWYLRRPKNMNNKGLVDQYRRPKMAYNTVKELLSDLDCYGIML